MRTIKSDGAIGNDCIFCTLFDSNYLDKGIVLYDSMCALLPSFKLYVFAFDDIAADILNAMGLNNMIVIPLNEFETDELKKVKDERSAAEYCWTCTPWTIKHVLERYSEDVCTYIDADMRFFSSPEPVFEDMRAKGCSIIITPHRFGSPAAVERGRNRVGEFCVEFNTFVNDNEGLEALNWWADRCLDWCYYAKPGSTKWYGDQKYLNMFEELFEGVYVCNHLGVGLAPWNSSQVVAASTDDLHPMLRSKKTGEVFPLIIHHFAGMYYLSNRYLNACSRMPDKRLHHQVYDVYVEEIIAVRKRIEREYGFEISKTKRTVTKNPLMWFYQKFLQPVRHIRKLTDLYKVE